MTGKKLDFIEDEDVDGKGNMGTFTQTLNYRNLYFNYIAFHSSCVPALQMP